jgi:1-hydroxycarotenoid 3,4-desaturase
MLIAHVERQGVWCVDGGMRALAHAIADLAIEHGAQFHYQSQVRKINCTNGRATGITLASGETLTADAIIFNGDTAALSDGLLGDDVVKSTRTRKRGERGLSAITWCIKANTSGFELDHHNVFFATDYEHEFTTIFNDRSVCNEPTVYVCAQDRVNGELSTDDKERLLLLINAPADGDHGEWTHTKLEQQRQNALKVLSRGGLKLDFTEEDCVTTGPDNWHQRFPGSAGSLYGAASHGMFSSFSRPSSTSRVKGLYLAGGSAHPGPGVPMATLSGSIAAQRIQRDAA